MRGTLPVHQTTFRNSGFLIKHRTPIRQTDPVFSPFLCGSSLFTGPSLITFKKSLHVFWCSASINARTSLEGQSDDFSHCQPSLKLATRSDSSTTFLKGKKPAKLKRRKKLGDSNANGDGFMWKTAPSHAFPLVERANAQAERSGSEEIREHALSVLFRSSTLRELISSLSSVERIL